MVIKILGLFGVIIIVISLVIYIKDKRKEASKVQFK